MPTPLPIEGRPLRLGVVGLGQIAELMLPSYGERADVEIVGICDRSPSALTRWTDRLPAAAAVTDVGALLELQPDVVDVYVPTPYHTEVVVPLLEAGVHVQCQKPIARTVEDCDRMLAAARGNGVVLRILEDYLFYEPLLKLRAVVASGEIGEPTGVHMKIVGTGRGGWDVDMRSYIWQFEQAKDGRGMLVFDHGWHQLAVAHSMFGPVRRIYAWIGETRPAPELAPEVLLDAPSTLVWEHHNGVRGVMDVTLSPDQYFRSDYYTCDERVEVTGSRGYARCNRISAYGIQEPSVVVYAEGEMRGFHALADTPPDAFRASTAHALDVFLKGETPVVMSGEASRDVLAALEAAIVSAREGHAVDVAN